MTPPLLPLPSYAGIIRAGADTVTITVTGMHANGIAFAVLLPPIGAQYPLTALCNAGSVTVYIPGPPASDQNIAVLPWQMGTP